MANVGSDIVLSHDPSAGDAELCPICKDLFTHWDEVKSRAPIHGALTGMRGYVRWHINSLKWMAAADAFCVSAYWMISEVRRQMEIRKGMAGGRNIEGRMKLWVWGSRPGEGAAAEDIRQQNTENGEDEDRTGEHVSKEDKEDGSHVEGLWDHMTNPDPSSTSQSGKVDDGNKTDMWEDMSDWESSESEQNE